MIELGDARRFRAVLASAVVVAAGLLIASLLAACSNPDGASLGEAGIADSSAVRYTADVGCDPRMDASFQAWAERGVGASIVDVGGDRQCVGAYGLADQETGRKNTVDTVFAIGSITKPITAAAIFNLMEDGLLTLDDTADQHVAGLGAAAGQSTIRDLLLHTSGLAGEHGYDHVPMSKPEAIAEISALGVVAEPGSSYRYENTNYTILALIIDELSDQGYRQYIVDEILLDRNGEPLGGGWWDGSPAPEGSRAWGYFGDEAARQRGDAPGPHWAMEGNGLMAMTPLQMAEWIYAFFNRRILSPEATEQFLQTSTRLAGEDKELPGWGEVDRTRFGEPIFVTAGGGSGIGHEMTVAWMPESSRVIVIARNALDHDVPWFASEIAGAMLAGTGIPTPPSIVEVDPALLERAVGVYQVGQGGRLAVGQEDGGLLITATGVEAMAALFPVPSEKLASVAEHQSQALAVFSGGGTLESDHLLKRVESMYGSFLAAEVGGTFFDNELVTVLSAQFESAELSALVYVDLFGNAFFEPVDGPATYDTFFAPVDDGFAPRFPGEFNPGVIVRPTGAGIEIIGRDATIVANRAAEPETGETQP